MNRETALIALGRALGDAGYRFVTVTPATHALVNARGPRLGTSLRDVFGWSRPFLEDALAPELFGLLGDAEALVESHGVFRSTIRFSSLFASSLASSSEHLFVHSAHPTTGAGAVFFGPDTYRFCGAIARAGRRAERVVDIGCGSGAGGIVAARSAQRIVLADVNPEALAFSRVNAALAGVTAVEVVQSDVLAGVAGPIDFIVANPPYMRDELHRAYRDGGGELGEELALRIVREAIERLAPGGALLLYTGAPVVAGVDVFWRAAEGLLEPSGMTFSYEELDPDVFGEELAQPGYAAVERIAAVVLTATRSSG
jgi:release factor glutamine methyltransferase